MKYNILTVANETYSPFIKLFVNSIFEFVDLENIENIYIFDTGFDRETTEYVKCFPKVVIVDSQLQTTSDAIHDNGWKVNTYSKTKFLLDTLKKDKNPIFMIDADSIFRYNFEDLIDWKKSIVTCKRDRVGFSKHIGSFFGIINYEEGVDFLEKWIKNIQFLQETTSLKHCESPALSKTIEEGKWSNQEIEENLVSAVFPTKESMIYHLKSDSYATTIEQRLALPHAAPFVQRYM